MKVYDTIYPPDTFGRIRMGLITEMFLTFDGFMKPNIGDHLRISCMYKGVVRDVYIVVIQQVSESVADPDTVLIRVSNDSERVSFSRQPTHGSPGNHVETSNSGFLH